MSHEATHSPEVRSAVEKALAETGGDEAEAFKILERMVLEDRALLEAMVAPMWRQFSEERPDLDGGALVADAVRRICGKT